MKNIYAKLASIQAKLFVPKGKKNEFGGFNYRSCEDILKVLKPLLVESKCALHLANEMIAVGDRAYVEVTATLVDCESGESVSVKAQAREPAVKKGMDEMQVTGATSSYARKYALAGLFCIDNEKDADDCDNRDCGRAPAEAPRAPARKPQPSLGAQAWATFKQKNAELEEAEMKLAFTNAIKEALDLPADATVTSTNITAKQWEEILKAVNAA